MPDGGDAWPLPCFYSVDVLNALGLGGGLNRGALPRDDAGQASSMSSTWLTGLGLVVTWGGRRPAEPRSPGGQALATT